MTAPLRISNRAARTLWLDAQGLAPTPTGRLDLADLITRLGMVQLDTIQVVSRAHHHILWSRNQNYREPMLNRLMARDRAVFEHFSHDACVLPMQFYPLWGRQFDRMRAKMDKAGWFRGLPDAAGRAAIKARIADEGPLSTHAFDSQIEGPREMWRRPPHKLALDYMWYGGELATSHRQNFTKFYDLSERVIPAHLRARTLSDDAQLDALCRAALDRLAFASPGEIQRFWDVASARDVRHWLEPVAPELVAVEYQAADGTWHRAFAPADIETRLANTPEPTSRLRILNPFDPVIRDRTRLSRLFGFDYRIEIFVPAAKRIWGYYVYPILEGLRMVGRIEVKADRQSGSLCVSRLWREPGVSWTATRQGKLHAELERMARFVGVPEVIWTCAERPEGAPA